MIVNSCLSRVLLLQHQKLYREGLPVIEPLPHQSVGFYFSDLSFLTLKGIGLHYIDSPQYCWKNQNRKDELCLVQYCVAGEGALEIDGVQYSIRPGEAFILDIPGKSCYYLPSHALFWEVLYLEFSKECLPLLRNIYQAVGPVLAFSPESQLVQQMFHIYECALNNELTTLFENTKVAYNFWIDLTACALEQSNRKRSSIDYAKSYIDQNYFRPDLSLDLIAEHVDMSKYSMCREFHKKFGLAPGKYLRELRISHACRLLTTHSDYTIHKIAHMVGYASDNYFGKVFKAVKGVPPDQFRKNSSQYDVVRVVHEM